MKADAFPQDIRPYLMPSHEGRLIYRCLGCGREYGIEKLLYICPECQQVLLIYDQNFARLKNISGALWQQIFDYRKMLNIDALKGIYRYHEFIGFHGVIFSNPAMYGRSLSGMITEPSAC